MTLEAKLRDIQKKLKDNRNFPNESSISQGIVLPILQELNWDIFDTKVVCPELSLPGPKRKPELVDFALYEPPDEKAKQPPDTKAKVFIEVKAKGFKHETKEDAETQLLRYTKGGEIPFAVLTDGGTWSFYLPEQGGRGYGERRVSELDILKHTPQESSEVLQRYLERNRVVSGEAFETARVIFFLEKYREGSDRDLEWKKVNDAIVRFERTRNFLVEALEEDIKPKPTQNNIDHGIVDYFHSLLRERISQPPSGATAQRMQSEAGEQIPARLSSGASERKQPAHRRVRQDSPPLEPEAPPVRDLDVREKGRGPNVLIKEIVIRGQHFPCSNQKGNQKKAMAIVFKQLQEEDPGFLQRFYKDSRNQRSRGGPLYLGRNQRELFGKNVERTRYEPIGRDWIISTNYGWEAPGKRSSKKKIIKLAAEVAGLKLKLEEDISGKGIIVNLDT